jgi:hypothetical protein
MRMPKFLIRAAVIVALLMLFFALRSIHWAKNRPAISDISIAPKPLPTCTDTEIEAAFDALPAYQPTSLADFVRVQNGQFAVGDERFFVHGVNYYPSRYPWRLFLTQTDTATINKDFALFQSVDFNTLRIFLWNEALFTCPGSGPVPVADAFMRLDGMVQKAAERDLRLIVTLNDLPDLTDYPLYDDPLYVLAQTKLIVQRYRAEPAILAWDLRNEGVIDYDRGAFTRDAVLDWLGRTSAFVRSLDANHLITAGWLHDSEATIPYVDLVSFHHWSGVPQVHHRIVTLQKATDKPVLLQEFGYST